MANEMRDRLVELFKKIEYTPYLGSPSISNLALQFTDYALYSICDDLIENGVIVPPCKVGQIVYIINDFDTEEPYVLPVEVVELGQSKNGQWIAIDLPLGLKISRYISWDDIGKDIFLTKAEAEQKLKEMMGE
jgi:hypothetical protein